MIEALVSLTSLLSPEELRQEMRSRCEEFVEAIDILYPAAADVADSISQLFADRIYWLRPDDENHSYDRIQNTFDRMDILSRCGTFDSSASTGDTNDNSNSNSGNRNRSFSSSSSSSNSRSSFSGVRARSPSINSGSESTSECFISQELDMSASSYEFIWEKD